MLQGGLQGCRTENGEYNALVMSDPTERKLPLKLELNISDPNIIRYLSKFESPLRETKAEEALKVGVIAILSASPSLDTKVVEEKFNEVDRKIREYADEFKKALNDELRGYFEKEKGTLPTTLQSFLGDKGLLGDSLKNYFDDKTGKVKLFLAAELGPGSEFSKSLDPNNKASVIARIEAAVSKQLTDVTQGLIDQFSLDKTESGMSRIKKLFDVSIGEIKSTNETFFNELREHLNIQKAVAIEAEKGTQKGRDFETVLYDYVANLGRQMQDETENVRAIPGEGRSKVGDYIITLGNTTAAPGKRIVVEAKKEQDYRMRDALDEIKQAKENRKADCGIFVFTKGYAPPEMGNFKLDGYDFFCTVDEDELAKGKSLLFLDAAYQIARINIITRFKKELIGEIDLALIKTKIEGLLVQTQLMSDLITKSQTIQRSGKAIEETALSIKQELDSIIKSILELLK